MPKYRKAPAVQDRAGVSGVQLIVSADLNWIFREQPTDDYGIDAHLEVVDGEIVTGKLVGLQIKSGQSYFDHPASGGWWYYLDADDLDYWERHSLPVLVVLYDTTSRAAYWQSVTKKNLIPTKPSSKRTGGHKLLIPSAQTLDVAAKHDLAELAEGNAYELRIRRLRLALPWMHLLVQGRRILLEADEWVNKTSGRGDLAIISVDDANEDRQELGTWGLLAGSQRYEDVLPQLIPWANVVLHEETYDDADQEAFESEAFRYDKEDGKHYEMVGFDDWALGRDLEALRPYSNSAGEIDLWRLELKLNELGRAFLLLDEFAEGETPFLTPTGQ
jgi:hypothetical protein